MGYDTDGDEGHPGIGTGDSRRPGCPVVYCDCPETPLSLPTGMRGKPDLFPWFGLPRFLLFVTKPQRRSVDAGMVLTYSGNQESPTGTVRWGWDIRDLAQGKADHGQMDYCSGI